MTTDDDIVKALDLPAPDESAPMTEAVAIARSFERAVATATQGEVEKERIAAHVATQQAKLDSEDFRAQLKLDGERQHHEARITTIVVIAGVVVLLLVVGTAVLLFAFGRSDDARQILTLVLTFLGGGGIGGVAGFARGWSHAKRSHDAGDED